ncbi:hypothetical protein [Microbulbifer sp. VAAF005]|uniref:hypothetical protein n=1 Tax=Microbulbifer sp. VAAF005 TaxID=3034230 RepID=UPI0024AD2399|nr:hypothetical protein [Microbulbifer sp. VAAF005]WHI46398.1 hypothetical protein P0078_22255 [Microbulbifer sp. VAAF005]
MGSSFKSEQDLVATYTGTLVQLNDKTKSWTQEFDCASSIADVVLFNLRKDWQAQSGLGRIAPRWAFTLFSLPYRKQFSLEFFIERTGATKRTALIILKEYESAGYCRKVTGRSDLWVKFKQPTRPTKKIVAIEAKLKNWQRALKQAYRYLEYANQSWVLLDEKYSSSALRNLNEFKRLNVGLKTMSTSGKIDIIWSPQMRDPKSDITSWQASANLTKLALDKAI